VHEDGDLRRLNRIEAGQLRAFAESLGPEDMWCSSRRRCRGAIAELIAEHAGRVTVSNPMRTRATERKVKTDKDRREGARAARRGGLLAGGVGA
jgi:hypothetical protein